jgi:hypothetical protein
VKARVLLARSTSCVKAAFGRLERRIQIDGLVGTFGFV